MVGAEAVAGRGEVEHDLSIDHRRRLQAEAAGGEHDVDLAPHEGEHLGGLGSGVLAGRVEAGIAARGGRGEVGVASHDVDDLDVRAMQADALQGKVDLALHVGGGEVDPGVGSAPERHLLAA